MIEAVTGKERPKGKTREELVETVINAETRKLAFRSREAVIYFLELADAADAPVATGQTEQKLRYKTVH